jgi:hypothetical protein
MGVAAFTIDCRMTISRSLQVGAAGESMPTVLTTQTAGRVSWISAAVVTLLVASVPAVLWPGDGVWIWDEPMEFAKALQSNQEHRLASSGLSGSFPVPFGALGIHLYQLWLLFTHDPRKLVVLHALTCAIPTAIALLWLARTLRLNPWFAAAIMAGPHMWFEARRLWQPSFCVPLSAMAIAALASFLRRRSGWPLLLAIGCAIAPLFMHLQAFPLSAAILGYLVWRLRPALRQHWLGIAVVLGGFAALQGSYLISACVMILKHCIEFIRTGHNSNTPLSMAWAGPLLTGRLFSGWDFDKPVLRVLSSAAMPLVWLGIWIAVWSFLSQLRAGSKPEPAGDVGESEMDVARVRGMLLSMCLAGVAIHLAMCITARLAIVHHYFFGVFGMYALLAWIALESLPRWWLRAGIVGVQGLAAAALTGGVIWQVHRDGWPRAMSPTIDEQAALARKLDGYVDRTAYTEVPVYMERPFVLWYMRQLIGSAPAQARTHSGRLFIRYRNDADGRPTNRIELVETDVEPAGAKLIALTPDAEQEAGDVAAVRGSLTGRPSGPWRQWLRRIRSEALDMAFAGSRFYRMVSPDGTWAMLQVGDGGTVTTITDDPASYRVGLVLVRDENGARVAGAAVMSLVLGERAPVEPEDVRVVRGSDGWVCKAGRAADVVRVRFDGAGRCMGVERVN